MTVDIAIYMAARISDAIENAAWLIFAALMVGNFIRIFKQ